jgi:hypothetical protein
MNADCCVMAKTETERKESGLLMFFPKKMT